MTWDRAVTRGLCLVAAGRRGGPAEPWLGGGARGTGHGSRPLWPVARCGGAAWECGSGSGGRLRDRLGSDGT